MRIEKSKDGRIIYMGDVVRSDIVIVPDYYSMFGGMKAIVLDVYVGYPDDNDDLHEMCRVMLEDGTFEEFQSWDLKLLHRQAKFNLQDFLVEKYV